MLDIDELRRDFLKPFLEIIDGYNTDGIKIYRGFLYKDINNVSIFYYNPSIKDLNLYDEIWQKISDTYNDRIIVNPWFDRWTVQLVVWLFNQIGFKVDTIC